MSLNLKYAFVLMLSFMVAAGTGAQKTSEPVSETTQKAETKKASAADEPQLVKVNKVERADEIFIPIYFGGKPTLKDLIDFDKLRAIRFTGKPVDVYLGSITIGADTDKLRAAIKKAGGPTEVYPSSYATHSQGPWFEHYYGTIREEGVVSDIGCVRYSSIDSKLITEGDNKGMLAMRLGIYPVLDEKPDELRGGVLARKGDVIRFR